MLEKRDWYCKNTHGNQFQAGFPDIYACHAEFRPHWIEVKMPTHYAFTKAQLETFHRFSAKGVGIWVLNAATMPQYQLLFGPPNWHMFLPVMK